MTKGYDRDAIRDMLVNDLQVWYVKKPDINKKREQEKEDTIEWILNRLQAGPQPGGTSARMPDCTFTFGDLWEPIAKAVRMKHPFCQICGKVPTQEIHHIRPRYLRGTNDPCNLVGLCFACHDEVHRHIDQGIAQALADSMEINGREDSND